MVRSDYQAIRVAAVRPVTVFYCKDGRQIITNVDSPTLGRTSCVDTVSHLSSSHRARFRVTASSTLTSYLWMHVKLPYPPPPPAGWFQKLISSNSYAYFLWDQPSVAQHRPNPGTNFVIGTSCQFIVLFIVVRA
jgi:hypothetical protein